MFIKVLALCIIVLLSFSACSTRGNPYYTKNQKKKNSQTSKTTKKRNQTKTIAPAYKPNTKNWKSKALYKEYKKWYATNYEYGGLDRNGVDCSALVQSVYKSAFNVKLPRTTHEQVKKGFKVNKHKAKIGDLVFFKTGYSTRHSGIIIENGKFIHASTSHGVTISELNNPYWKARYWQIRRILP